MPHADPGLPHLREILLFLVLAGLLIPLLQRLRINQVLGFLAVGMVVGPFGIARWVPTWPVLEVFSIARDDGVAALGQLGVLFLMFLVGLELPAKRLWGMRRWVFGAGTAQVLVTALVVGGVSLGYGNGLAASLVLGLVLALSSTAVVVPLLTERKALGTPTGQAVFSVLMLQDLAVVPILLLIDVLGQGGAISGGALAVLFGQAALKSVLAVGLVLVLGRRVVGPMFRSFARHRQPDVFMALTLLTTLGIAGVTAAAGLSMALGAFMAGLLLAETEFRHEVEVTIEPFKGLLMGLFFMTVGMGIDLREVAREPLWLPVSVLGLCAIKSLIAAAVFRVGGLRPGQALEGGMLLGQGGEFAFIVVGAATASGLLSTNTGQFMLLVVAASLLATPTMAHLAKDWGQRLGSRDPLPGPEVGVEAALALAQKDGARGHLIIAGAGRVGQLLVEMLGRQGVSVVAVEQDAHVVAQLRAKGIPVVYGNAARVELLDKLHAQDAAAVLITMDQPGPAMHTVRSIRKAFSTLPVLARSRDEKHARELRKEGANVVVPETLESALHLGAMALQQLGWSEGDAAAAVHAERELRLDA